ncbi:hypothetical protein N9L06_00265 [Mariniblastus sp.]|nr:hypothetical protein [Mariniblastus sp.]
MSEEKTTKKKSTQKPIKTFRVGAIAANVWQRQTPTGFEYLDFSLSRSWKLKSGEKEGYSTSFFHNNEEALIEVIEQATAFIVENTVPASEMNNESDS